jgi:solute carrier family 13 (sodium-dependent dicarboxylate transporter), member 2/3/5
LVPQKWFNLCANYPNISMKNRITKQGVAIVAGPMLFFLLQVLGSPADMEPAAFRVLGATAWIILWWVTEAVPIAVTALMPMILFPLLGISSMNAITQPYSQPIIYLFVGGFVLALAMERWNLHRRIALEIVARVGTNRKRIILGFVIATGFLSMWISNTATTVMMLPIALSLISQFEEFRKSSGIHSEQDDFGKALILSIPYSASIGGVATLVGTPTNLIFAQSVKDYYQVDIAFDEWMWVGVPIAVLLLAATWWYITRVAYNLQEAAPGERQASIIREQLHALGKMRREEKWVLLVFSLVALAWITRRYWINPFFPAVDDTNIVLIGAVLLFLIPATRSEDKPRMLMDWPTALKLPWGVLLLFGGAFAVAKGFEDSGLTGWIGDKLGLLEGVPFWLVLLIIVAVVNFMTELTQNMATCTLMMPVLAALSQAIDTHPFGLMAGACIAASCAFMLPVATAPNAVVFGAGVLKMEDMVRTGFVLNLISVLVITVIIYFLMPLFWNIRMDAFPF